MIEIKDIHDARKRIGSAAIKTPLLESELLNQRLGIRLLVKAECLQNTGAFKIRGATNCIKANLEKSPDMKAVVAYSSGNHAQGVALAAKKLGLSATIIMPEDAPASKISNTKAYGARVVHFNRYTDSREEVGSRIVEETGGTLIKPFDDPLIMAGQGTVGLEIAEQLEEANITADAVVVPCGGGGLISGISVALNGQHPDLSIFAAEPEAFDDTKLSLESGNITQVDPANKSICDAIMSVCPGQLTFPVIQKNVDDVLLVSDNDVLHAMAVAYKYLKVVIEPGGAAALAGVLNGQLDSQFKTVIAVASGGNVDEDMFKQALDHG